MYSVVLNTTHHVLVETNRLFLIFTPDKQINAALLKEKCTTDEARMFTLKMTFGDNFAPSTFPSSDAVVIPSKVPYDFKPEWAACNKKGAEWPFSSEELLAMEF